MNVVFLLLTTAASAAGQAPAMISPAAPPAGVASGPIGPGPISSGPITSGPIGHGTITSGPVTSGPMHDGCGGMGDCGCGDCGYDCCGKPSFMDRLRGLFASRRCGCEVAPCCEAPVAQAPCCGAIATHGGCGCCEETCCKPSLLDRLRARFSKSCCEPAGDCGCGCGDEHGGYVGHGVGGSVGAVPGPVGHGVPSGVIGGVPSGVIGGVPSGAVGGVPSGGFPSGATYGSPLPGMGSPNGTGVPAAGPERLKMPKGEGDKKGETVAPPPPVLTPTGAQIETEAKNPFESARRDDKRVGRAADYSKLTGRLSFVHADGGLWVLRYAPLSEEDTNGGSVVLARDRKMDSYREGDLVTVEGQILSQRASSHLGGALYQVQTISLVDRPQR